MNTTNQIKVIVLSFLSIVVMVGVIAFVSMQTTKVVASHGGGEHGTEHASTETEKPMTEEHAAPESATEEKVSEAPVAETPKEETPVATVAGDAEAGKAVFLNAANMCATCHAIDGLDGAAGAIGPKLNGLGDRAGKTVAGQDAVAYIKASLENPNGYVVANYAPSMPAGLNKNMSEEEYTNLVAYLASL